ncbi:tryptophan biosynthesis modulator TrpM [Streptomyces sp. NPDC004779]|uniref:tryptophan biosynthesis modulator TrpM n=1 Tax=Streptomyces sp. NPDC056049 TaxID=3345693 RepID=UPI0035E38AD9
MTPHRVAVPTALGSAARGPVGPRAVSVAAHARLARGCRPRGCRAPARRVHGRRVRHCIGAEPGTVPGMRWRARDTRALL